VRAALVTPLSGPLAGYGRAGAVALELWAAQAGAALATHDAHPDPAAAVRAAERERPDLLFGPYGSGPARAVAAATSRLVFNHGGARVGLAENVVSVLAPAETYFEGTLRVVREADAEARRVWVLHADTGFGRAVAEGAADEARRLGMEVTRSVLPTDGGGPEATRPAGPADADVLLVVGGFADELAAARRLLPGRWRAAGFVGAGVEEVLAELGARREGLLGPAQWLAAAGPAPDEGPSAAEFVAAYRARAGADPPSPAAQAFAAGVVAARCLRDTGTAGDAALLAAARALDCTTLYGRFRLDPDGRQVGHRVLTVQWQDGARRVVWPREQAQAALRHPLSRARAPGRAPARRGRAGPR
jgi:branched-chain amino acid transport system substrate-binding protein